MVDIPQPEPREGEVLVRTLRVGIDGTDHEVITGSHGGFPEDEDYQILGHEAVGVVADANGTELEEGQLVVPTVRRPPDGQSNEYFARGEPDMAPAGAYVERGIAGAHGYMAAFFTSTPEFLVPVPTTLADTGFLVEPISNVEKALELAYASRSAFQWTPETAFVLGNGPLGLLSLGLFQQHDFERTYCLGRRSRPDPTIDTIDALAPNGVGVLLGIPADWTFEIDGGRLHREFVLENKALVGSVNSHIPHFERAIETLLGYPDWVTDSIITHVFAPGEVDHVFETGEGRIKAVVEFDTP